MAAAVDQRCLVTGVNMSGSTKKQRFMPAENAKRLKPADAFDF